VDERQMVKEEPHHFRGVRTISDGTLLWGFPKVGFEFVVQFCDVTEWDTGEIRECLQEPDLLGDICNVKDHQFEGRFVGIR